MGVIKCKKCNKPIDSEVHAVGLTQRSAKPEDEFDQYYHKECCPLCSPKKS